ncbi:MAG: hypothetical protein NT023_06860 [Armatimonadetes bacterium]|nr:hypothetical protein [Armatimonadota bacterium]
MFFVTLSLLLIGCPMQDVPAPTTQNAQSIKRYQVTLRVIRPTWRKQPTVEEMKTGRGKYTAVLSNIFHPKDLNSDVELLSKLNKFNPEFKFEKFQNKRSFTLAADTIWVAPKDFSLNDFQFALIQNKLELLDMNRPAAGTVITLGKPIPTPHPSLSTPQSQYPPNVRKQIEEDGKVILMRTATLNSLVEGKKREYLRILGGGAYIIEKNATTCITYQVNAYWINGKVAFNPSDVVLLTVSDAK